MDYLTYAYLQRGRDEEAIQVVEQLHSMGPMLSKDFKVSYAATAMPVRIAVERERWSEAADIEPLPGSPAHVAAIAYWARALGHARSGHPEAVAAEIVAIDACEQQAAAHGDAYWASQVDVLSKEARAWGALAAGNSNEAVEAMRAAAEAEDSLEKLPVTPGPIVPAREQLGQILLELHRPKEALQELSRALKDAPGRRAALMASARAAAESGDASATEKLKGSM